MSLAEAWLPWIPIGLVLGAAVFATRSPSPKHDFRSIVLWGSNAASGGAFLGVFLTALVRGTVIGIDLDLEDVVLTGAAVGGGVGAFAGVAVYVRSVAVALNTALRSTFATWGVIAWWTFAVPVAIPFIAEVTLSERIVYGFALWSYVWPAMAIATSALYRLRNPARYTGRGAFIDLRALRRRAHRLGREDSATTTVTVTSASPPGSECPDTPGLSSRMRSDRAVWGGAAAGFVSGAIAGVVVLATCVLAVSRILTRAATRGLGRR